MAGMGQISDGTDRHGEAAAPGTPGATGPQTSLQLKLDLFGDADDVIDLDSRFRGSAPYSPAALRPNGRFHPTRSIVGALH